MNWTRSEKEFLLANYLTMSQKEMAEKLKRGHHTIAKWMDLLDLEKKPRGGQPDKGPRVRIIDKPLQWEKGKHLQDIWR